MTQPPPALWAGQRWSLDVRLKRAHGNANFGARDAEAALLARDIRATGYVRQRARHVGCRAMRSASRSRSTGCGRICAIASNACSATAPHRGIVVALAVGAQDGVSDSDWTLMRATGTSHLVAISGLHIGFVAGLAALIDRLCVAASAMARRAVAACTCRRRRWRRRGAAVFAALLRGPRGFQRAGAARAVDAAVLSPSRWSTGRRIASSLVLAWALALVLLADPWAVTAAGFWLSFCAVAAILYAMAAYGRRASKRRATTAITRPISLIEYDRAARAGRGVGGAASRDPSFTVFRRRFVDRLRRTSHRARASSTR